MRHFLYGFVIVCIAIIALWAVEGSAEVQAEEGLANLYQPKNYTAARASSVDPEGKNADWVTIEAGGLKEIARLQGPGLIDHIWITIAHDDPMHLKQLVLRMYWDNEKYPSVETPVGDFFGLGHGMVYDINSIPIQIGSYKGLNCFWPMPFGKSARITVENQSDIVCDKFYFYIDYRRGVNLPADTPYFHAWYNQSYPAKIGEDYCLMNTVGKGHYVGCNLSIHLNSSGWWGEGDDRFYIDGDLTPTLEGTGSEDYFCGAWCYEKAFSCAYIGAPLVEEYQHDRGKKWNVYRYHITDPIPFKKSLRFDIETYSDDRWPWPNHYSSVAYWYQTEPHLIFPPLPHDRVSKLLDLPVADDPGSKEGELMQMKAHNGWFNVVQQGKAGGWDGIWSNRAHLFIQFAEPGQWADMMFLSDENAEQDMEAIFTRAPDYGIVELAVNGTVILRDVDTYNPAGVDQIVRSVGKVRMNKGENLLRIKVTGKNPDSGGYYMGFDCLRVKN
ncbi:MAG: DUF2961 domain-containing protein [Sedimentisphaerales bacterium]|nr:DUF2961 domain-containing protein [Sedimentisphaerales bacterium]